MLDALKSLFENDAISKEIRAEIESAWNKKIDENRLEVTAELREEFAKLFGFGGKFLVNLLAVVHPSQ